MPITLPTGANTERVPIEVEGVSQYRVTDFRIDQLDRFDKLMRPLDGVQPGGTLSWSANASVKGGGSFELNDLGQSIDWLNDRFQVTAITSDDGRPEVETPLGVFLPSAPVASWKDGRRSWSVELHDKLSILDADQPAEVYSAPAGANVIELVRAIIANAGELSTAIIDDDVTLTNELVFEAGDTWLKIVNELLDAAGYFSLWCDGKGRFRASKYDRPKDRSPVYRVSMPFREGPASLLAPEWSHDEDIYSIPNRIIAATMGDDETEGIVATVTNEDPSSPFSFQNRGRWITERLDDAQTVEADETIDFDALKATAIKRMEAAMDVTATYEVEHVFLPDVLINSVVEFRAGDIDTRAAVTNTEISLDPEGLCKSTIRGVNSTILQAVIS